MVVHIRMVSSSVVTLDLLFKYPSKFSVKVSVLLLNQHVLHQLLCLLLTVANIGGPAFIPKNNLVKHGFLFSDRSFQFSILRH